MARFLVAFGATIRRRSTACGMFGYLLTSDTRLQKMFLIVGPKRSGKGTIARVLKALLGVANVAGPTLSGLGTNFGLAPLVGKPLAIISDARLSGRADQQVIAERLLASPAKTVSRSTGSTGRPGLAPCRPGS